MPRSRCRWRRLLSAVVVGLQAAACASSDFAGKGRQVSPPGPAEDSGTKTATTPEPELGQTQTSTGTGPAVTPAFDVAQCATAVAIQDQAGQFSFANDGEVRNFVNSLAKYPQIPTQYLGAGGIRADQQSKDIVCKLKGYDHSTAGTSSSYHSCHDNVIVWWEPAQKTFSVHNACDANFRINALTCTGKLKDECGRDAGWVFGQPAAGGATTGP